MSEELEGLEPVDDSEDGTSDDGLFEEDGQPTEYEEWQDFMGGDDWDHGQFDEMGAEDAYLDTFWEDQFDLGD